MKTYFVKVFRIAAILSLPVLLSQCKDDDEIRFEMDDLKEGLNFRVQRNVTQFDASDEASQVEFTYYTENSNIEKVEIYAEHYSLLADETTDRFLVEEVTGSTLTNDGSSKNVVTLQQLKDAIGVDVLDGGDNINILHVVHLTDGRVYPDTIVVGTRSYVNVESGIMLATTASFTPLLPFPISCPIEDETFGTGTYRVEIVSGANASPFGQIYGNNSTVQVTSKGGTVRSFDIPYLYQAVAGNESTVTFEFACNVVLVGTQSAGLTCGIGLYIVQDPAAIGQFDITDDSEFTIGFLHNIDNDCGLAADAPFTFKLTKQ